MLRPWRRLALAAALYLSVGVGAAAAQTVIVINAPPKAPVELVVNLSTVATETADAAGDATIKVNLPAILKKQEADVGIYLDACGNLRRVILVERGVQPTAGAPNCERREIPGLFVMKQVTNMLVDVASTRPAVWLKQGPVPKEWLLKGVEGEPSAVRTWRPLPTGLVLFGGGGLTHFSKAAAEFCGDVEGCKGDGNKRSFAGGLEVWVTRYLAFEGTFVRPAQVTGAATATSYKFNSSLKTSIVTVAAKPGIPAGPARVYAKGGLSYVEGRTRTSETYNEVTFTDENGQEITLPGNSQHWDVKTNGWRWMFGGGVEVWVSRHLALYAEFDHVKLKGKPEGGGEALLNDATTMVLGGLRLHIGKGR